MDGDGAPGFKAAWTVAPAGPDTLRPTPEDPPQVE